MTLIQIKTNIKIMYRTGNARCNIMMAVSFREYAEYQCLGDHTRINNINNADIRVAPLTSEIVPSEKLYDMTLNIFFYP